MKFAPYLFDGSRKFHIDEFPTRETGKFKNKAEAVEQIAENLNILSQLQNKLYAENKEAVLIIFQAMDAAGKDGAIKHVMSGINPQGVVVHNFKQPSAEELDHDYLWRCVRALPERGNIGIFNRSYYEDVLVGKVHKLYLSQSLPDRCKTDDIFEKRYRQIRDFETYLWENGIRVVKFFLALSKEEQKKRFLDRIDDKSKNWKFSEADIRERAYWDDYQKAYEQAINATARKHAPWYVIPADKKWYSRLLISEIIVDVLRSIDPEYPTLPKGKDELLQVCKQQLLEEE